MADQAAAERKDNQKAGQAASAKHSAPLLFWCELAAGKLSWPCAIQMFQNLLKGSRDVWSFAVMHIPDSK